MFTMELSQSYIFFNYMSFPFMKARIGYARLRCKLEKHLVSPTPPVNSSVILEDCKKTMDTTFTMMYQSALLSLFNFLRESRGRDVSR